MGASVSSQFEGAVVRRDLTNATQLLEKFPQKIVPSGRCNNAKHKHNTYFHLVALHGMHPLVIHFINIGGDPNIRNDFGQTTLHACATVPSSNNIAREFRFDIHSEDTARVCIMANLTGINGTINNSGEPIPSRSVLGREANSKRLKITDIDAVDDDMNTALHYAARSGLVECVKLLLKAGSNVFRKSKDGLTALDLADEAERNELATFLEGMMVLGAEAVKQDGVGFSGNLLSPSRDTETLFSLRQEVNVNDVLLHPVQFMGIDEKEFENIKSTQICQVADELQIPSFSAELLLRKFEWQTEVVLTDFRKDPSATCSACGVPFILSDSGFSFARGDLVVLPTYLEAGKESDFNEKDDAKHSDREDADLLKALSVSMECKSYVQGTGSPEDERLVSNNLEQKAVSDHLVDNTMDPPLIENDEHLEPPLIENNEQPEQNVTNYVLKESALDPPSPENEDGVKRLNENADIGASLVCVEEHTTLAESAEPSFKQNEHAEKKIFEGKEENIDLPYGGDILMAIRKQDRAGIKLIMNARKVESMAKEELALEDEISCDICASTVRYEDLMALNICRHWFCKACWKQHMEGKIREGEIHTMTCPAFRCDSLIPRDVVFSLVSEEAKEKYEAFDIKAFLEGNAQMRRCPFPDCSRAVYVPVFFDDGKERIGTVDCGCPSKSHLFCWKCLGEPHDPVSCEQWREWQEISDTMLAEARKNDLNADSESAEKAANNLWLLQNTKNCPRCKKPIEKNEGCNHMTCRSCRHEFCWICLGPWKGHGTETGGYYECNKFEEQKGLQEEFAAQQDSAVKMKKFLHFYSRFRNHDQSRTLEEKVLSEVGPKMQRMRDIAAVDISAEFIHMSSKELLENRLVLRNSYVLGYFLSDSFQKQYFESMQAELEDRTETLSGIVARRRLRTGKREIEIVTLDAVKKRDVLVTAVQNSLGADIDNETDIGESSSSRRRRTRRRPDTNQNRKHRAQSRHRQQPVRPWECESCTFINRNRRSACEMCLTENPNAGLEMEDSSDSQIVQMLGDESAVSNMDPSRAHDVEGEAGGAGIQIGQSTSDQEGATSSVARQINTEVVSPAQGRTNREVGTGQNERHIRPHDERNPHQTQENNDLMSEGGLEGVNESETVNTNTEWVCSVCTMQNRSSVNHCEVCSTSRFPARSVDNNEPSDLQAILLQSMEEEAKRNAQEDQGTIECPQCTFLNAGNLNFCGMCNSPLAKPQN